MLNLIYTYKIISTKKQIEQIELNLAVGKVVWNNALYQRKLWFNSRKCEINQCSLHSEYMVKPFEYPNYHKQSKKLGQQKKTNSFLKSGNAQAIAKTLGKLDRALADMKKKGCGFPRYKKAMKSFVLIPAKDNAKLESNAVVGIPLLKT